MDIPWPLDTTFHILIEELEETWTVSSSSNPQLGIINKETPLGKSLLDSGNEKTRSYELRDSSLVHYKIISIQPPDVENDVFDSPFDYYLHAYRSKPNGIHNNPYMADICLNCGHKNPSKVEGKRDCEVCGSYWYVNHCWKCIDKHVDSRDPMTPECLECKYWICVKCHSCFCGTGFLWTRDS